MAENNNNNTERKAGRPFGSHETPQVLLTRELKATVKAIGSIREVVETQLERINAALAKQTDIPINAQISMMNELGTLAQSLTRNAEMLAKYLMDKRVRHNTEDVEAEPRKTTSANLEKLLK